MPASPDRWAELARMTGLDEQRSARCLRPCSSSSWGRSPPIAAVVVGHVTTSRRLLAANRVRQRRHYASESLPRHVPSRKKISPRGQGRRTEGIPARGQGRRARHLPTERRTPPARSVRGHGPEAGEHSTPRKPRRPARLLEGRARPGREWSRRSSASSNEVAPLCPPRRRQALIGKIDRNEAQAEARRQVRMSTSP